MVIHGPFHERISQQYLLFGVFLIMFGCNDQVTVEHDAEPAHSEPADVEEPMTCLVLRSSRFR